MEKNRKNIYFTIWKAVKSLKKEGLITVSETHYHTFRNISLTESGWNWLDSRRTDIVGKTWRERSVGRCKKCKNWSTERMDLDGNIHDSGVAGCYHGFDVNEWICNCASRTV